MYKVFFLQPSPAVHIVKCPNLYKQVHRKQKENL